MNNYLSSFKNELKKSNTFNNNTKLPLFLNEKNSTNLATIKKNMLVVPRAKTTKKLLTEKTRVSIF